MAGCFDVSHSRKGGWRKLIGDALAECNGNQARAARLLGLKPTTLNLQIQRLGIDVNLYRQTPPNVSYET